MTQQNRSDNQGGRKEGNGEIQWGFVATAPDQLVAEVWQQLLREEFIPSMLAPHDTISFLGVTPTPVRLMVPLELKERAGQLLELYASDVRPPESDDPDL